MVDTTVGYAGGQTTNPTYGAVCSGQTGHAEIVEVCYDSDQINFVDLLNVFWSLHDPTLAVAGYRGGQYRSAIYFTTEEQHAEAIASIQREQNTGQYRRPIATELAPSPTFWRAEDYHQQYSEKHRSGTFCR